MIKKYYSDYKNNIILNFPKNEFDEEFEKEKKII